ncbi:unnamed protein product, partial [Mesorhabditis belari]|uniref:Transmembrane protein n=1 Tax=Mesorhabditis belari TaxID=2138241 RepID=A0AAF3E9G2_9BILA
MRAIWKRVLFTSDQLLTSSLRAHMDVLSSVVVMALLALGTLFSLIFIAFQLHGEMVHLVRLSTNVINSRPEWLSTVFNYTEEQLESNDIDLDNYVEQAYQQGRAWLASNVRSLADPKDTIRADMLEEQIKKIVDNVYRLWEQRNFVPSASSSEIVHKDWYQQLTSVTDLHALKEELTLIIKDNVDTLLNVAHSVWGILATNISFLSGVLGAFATLLLGFGMDLLNLLIAWVVFLTMLYYLLASSRDQWLPLEWASQLTALFNTVGTPTPAIPKQESSTVNDITSAVEQAIFGVFVLSIKMSIFYGLYTYFVHSLFDLNIVFVPSLAAAIFAAIPIMAPYIVCVFGLFELYLVRGETAASIVFLIISIAPVMFADAAFYKEVKYAHPYVTGLAVIGGMYWLSLQGAIIGPIILCIFLVLVNVYMKFAKGK